MHDEHGSREFAAEGAVVEIVERGLERFARVQVDGGAVLEVPAGSIDVGVGDRVVVDASLRIALVRGAAEPPPPVSASPPGSPPEAPASDARPAVRDYEHVLRMAALFAIGIGAFLTWRSWMVPSDFGVYGHYRAGAVEAAAMRPSHYAGQAACIDCHSDVQQVRATGRHAGVACEACHGPLRAHATGETDVAPIRPSPRAVCLSCHTALLGMPATFPKVVVNEHSEAGPCTECHAAHAPALSTAVSSLEFARPGRRDDRRPAALARSLKPSPTPLPTHVN